MGCSVALLLPLQGNISQQQVQDIACTWSSPSSLRPSRHSHVNCLEQRAQTKAGSGAVTPHPSTNPLFQGGLDHLWFHLFTWYYNKLVIQSFGEYFHWPQKLCYKYSNMSVTKRRWFLKGKGVKDEENYDWRGHWKGHQPTSLSYKHRLGSTSGMSLHANLSQLEDDPCNCTNRHTVVKAIERQSSAGRWCSWWTISVLQFYLYLTRVQVHILAAERKVKQGEQWVHNHIQSPTISL